RVDQAVQAHVSEGVQGYPLLVEELVTNLRDEGWLRAADGRWTLQVGTEEAAERGGPPGPPPPPPPPAAPPAGRAAGLRELVRLDLIRADHGPTSAPLPPNSGAGYRFRHATVKTVAYERLPDDRRAELHERYADWLGRESEDR